MGAFAGDVEHGDGVYLTSLPRFAGGQAAGPVKGDETFEGAVATAEKSV